MRISSYNPVTINRRSPRRTPTTRTNARLRFLQSGVLCLHYRSKQSKNSKPHKKPAKRVS